MKIVGSILVGTVLVFIAVATALFFMSSTQQLAPATDEPAVLTELDVMAAEIIEGTADAQVTSVDINLGLVGELDYLVRAEPLVTPEDWDSILRSIYATLPEGATVITVTTMIGGTEEEPRYASLGQTAALFELTTEQVIEDRTVRVDRAWLDARYATPEPETTETPAPGASN